MLRRLTALVRSRCVVAGIEARLYLPALAESLLGLWRRPALAGFEHVMDDDDSTAEEVDHLWFAAPKKRVSHSRKRMKIWMIGPKPISHLQDCQDCGKPKLRHKLAKCCTEAAIRRTAEMKLKKGLRAR